MWSVPQFFAVHNCPQPSTPYTRPASSAEWRGVATDLGTTTIINEVVSRAVGPAMVEWIEASTRAHGTLPEADRAELDEALAELKGWGR